jgi:hypothetical protein
VYASSSSALATGSALTFDGSTFTANANGTVSGIFNRNTSNGKTLDIQLLTQSVGWLGSNANGDFVITSTVGGLASNNLIFANSNGTEAMRLTSSLLNTASGVNVAIGASSTSSKLYAASSVNYNPSLTTGAASGFLINNAGQEISFGGSGVAPYPNYIQSRASGIGWDLVLNPLGGNVGIGTPSPSTKLELYQVTSSRNTVTDMLTLNNYSATNPYDGFGNGIVFKGLDYSNYPQTYGSIVGGIYATDRSSPQPDTGFAGILRFLTGTNGANAQRMSIASTQMLVNVPVGIGTDFPTQFSTRLGIVGTGSSDEVVLSATSGYSAGSAISRLRLGAYGSNGYLGCDIYTTSYYAATTGTFLNFATSPAGVSSSTTPIQRMQIGSEGDVGIGSGATGAYRLTVAKGNETTGQVGLANFRTEATGSTTYNAGVQIFATASATAGSRLTSVIWDADGADSAGGNYFYITKYGNDGRVDLLQASNAEMNFATNYAGRGTIDMVLGTTGNLGIGTSGESMRLAMAGTIADSTYPLIKGTVRAPYVGGWNTLAPETTIGGYQLFTYRSDNGEINKSSAVEVYLVNNSFGAGITGMRFITGGYNSTNGLEAMRINELQNVLVGQTAVGNGGKLAVNGSISIGTTSGGSQASMAKDTTQLTTGVSTTATTIFTDISSGMSSASAGYFIIYGHTNSGAGFMDVVIARANGTAVVVSSSIIEGSPAARTYSVSSFALQLTMASGTYNVNLKVTAIGYPF